MDHKSRVRVSKLMSLGLRHEPAALGLTLDEGGWVDVELGLSPKVPPAELFHGTSEHVLPEIHRDGLLRMARTHVHLSTDVETASIVAKRRTGPTVLLRVDAAAMYRDGHAFLCADNGVWLTLAVPPRYLRFPDGC